MFSTDGPGNQSTWDAFLSLKSLSFDRALLARLRKAHRRGIAGRFHFDICGFETLAFGGFSKRQVNQRGDYNRGHTLDAGAPIPPGSPVTTHDRRGGARVLLGWSRNEVGMAQAAA